MANEIDDFILQKFGKDVNQVEGKPLHGTFQHLMELLVEKAPPESFSDIEWRRNKLYQVSHVLAEYRTCKGTDLNGIIKSSLEDIEKEINVRKNPGKDSKETTLAQTTVEMDSTLDRRGFFSQGSHVADPTTIYGFEEEDDFFASSLPSDTPFKAIAIVGIAGAGKTTFCQRFYNSQQVRDSFLPRIWVTVSRQPVGQTEPREALVRSMVTQLGVEETVSDNCRNRHGTSGLLSLLHQQLWGKRYLVILDDVCEDYEWYRDLHSCISIHDDWGDRFAYGLPKGHGGAVIVTSRSEEAAKHMVRAENVHQLKPLPDRDICWQIFKDAAEKEHLHAIEFEREITRKCAGIPLAAKLMGKMVNKKLSTQGMDNQ